MNGQELAEIVILLYIVTLLYIFILLITLGLKLASLSDKVDEILKKNQGDNQD